MAWIESHEHLEKNGRLLKLADILGINKYQAIGHLHAFWWWATHNAGRDGDLSQCDPITIAAASGWQTYVNEVQMDRSRGPCEVPDASAFCHALIEVGFIDVANTVNEDWTEPLGDGAKIHQWEKYSCRYFNWIESLENRRESERIRQRRRRESIRKSSRTPERDCTRPNLTKPDLTKPNIKDKDVETPRANDLNNIPADGFKPPAMTDKTRPRPTIHTAHIGPHMDFVRKFGQSYEAMTGQPFKASRKSYEIAKELIDRYGAEKVGEKVQILGKMCADQSVWFTKDGWADFTIEKISAQWNSIIESYKETPEDKQRKIDEDAKKKVREKNEQLNRAMGRGR